MKSSEQQTALELKLLAMADDELILAHRNSEWCGHAPILEEDIAFANIAQDELGHAKLWYDLLGALSGDDPDQLVFFRGPDAFRNVRLVEMPKGDWAFTITRQYLFDAFELVRAEQLVNSGYRPLAQAAAKVYREELYHYRHTHTWIGRLGQGTRESNLRTQRALNALWFPVFQLFLPLPKEEILVRAGVLPSPDELRQEWEAIVLPVLKESGLSEPNEPEEPPAGREAHTTHLTDLLSELQEVARLDPEAEW